MLPNVESLENCHNFGILLSNVITHDTSHAFLILILNFKLRI